MRGSVGGRKGRVRSRNPPRRWKSREVRWAAGGPHDRETTSDRRPAIVTNRHNPVRTLQKPLDGDTGGLERLETQLESLSA